MVVQSIAHELLRRISHFVRNSRASFFFFGAIQGFTVAPALGFITTYSLNYEKSLEQPSLIMAIATKTFQK